MRNLTLEGIFVIFKTLAITKNVFQSFVTTVSKNEVEKMQKAFLWKNSTSMIKHESLCNDDKPGGLKNVNIPNKIIALQCFGLEDFTIILSMNRNWYCST